MLYFVLSSFYVFLNTKSNVATNLNLLSSDNKSISLFLITDSVSLSCSSGSKKSKPSHYTYLHSLYKADIV